MGNFFSDWYDDTVGGLGDAGPGLDPVGYYYKSKDDQYEEEEARKRAERKGEEDRRRAELEAQAARDKLNSKIRDVLDMHGNVIATEGDKKSAARRAAAKQRQRGGRESTFLSGDLLGG